MSEDMRMDAMETVVTAIEKHADNHENAARMITTVMGKRYGQHWHCFIGEGFGFSVTFETRHMLYMYHGGNLAILLFKAS